MEAELAERVTSGAAAGLRYITRLTGRGRVSNSEGKLTLKSVALAAAFDQIRDAAVSDEERLAQGGRICDELYLWCSEPAH